MIRVLQLLISTVIYITISYAQLDSNVSSGVISEDIVGLGAPENSTAVSLYDLDVELESEEAYIAIQQGFGHLLSLWDFQAYRFFVEALRLEANSIMATSGLTLALCSSDRHLLPESEVAITRLRELLKGESGTEYEREFGHAVLKLISGNFKGWLASLEALADRDKKGWKMPLMLNVYYARDGYTARGEPKLEQRKAIEALRELKNETPEDPASLVFYVTAQMDDPKLDAYFVDEIFASAQKLVSLYPDFPVYHKLLGYCELRSGDPFLAAESYGRAHKLYNDFLSENSVPIRNCIDLVSTQLGKISAQVLQEDFTGAIESNTDLQSLVMSEHKVPAMTKAAQLWESGSFPLRIAIASGQKAIIESEIKAMEEKLKSKSKEAWSAVEHNYNSILLYSKGYLALLNGDKNAIATFAIELNESNKILYETYDEVLETNAVLYWKRAMNFVFVLENELLARAELAEKSSDRITFLNLVSKAIDEQRFYTQFAPPLLLEPTLNLKARYLLRIDEDKEALKVLDESYLKMPNHPRTLELLESVLNKLERSDDANQVGDVVASFKKKQELKQNGVVSE